MPTGPRRAARKEPGETVLTIPLDVPEADALDQARPWVEPVEPVPQVSELPEDAAEADALEQALAVPVEEDEDRR